VRAELDVFNPSEPPAYVTDRPIEQKADEILRWIEGNFSRANEADLGYLFEDYDNADELEQELELHDRSTEELVKYAWGLFATVSDFEKIVALIDKEDTDKWLPQDHLIDLAQVDFDDDVSLEDLQARVPSILSRIADFEKQLPHGLGHNGPPEQLAISRDTIKELVSALEDFQKLEQDEIEDEKGWLLWLAEKARTISGAVSQYSLKVANEFTNHAVAAAGEQFGKWGTRAAIFVFMSNALSSFADDLIRLLSN
jgi:hypothetical protein